MPKSSPFPTVFGAEGLQDGAESGAPAKPDNDATDEAVKEQPKAQRMLAGSGPRRTVGMLPSKPDLGSEADMVSTANLVHPPAFDKRWTYVMAGYLRAPMRVGLGPKNDFTSGQELHSAPRTVGFNANEWTNAGIAPGPEASLYITIENVRAAGTVILQANTFWDVGFKSVETMGGISQAYVTLKFPGAFSETGGFSWTVGGFSGRYGNAGPRQNSSGYYQTQLFGRTHVLGEALTFDLRLGGDMNLVLEHGVGAKLEVVPFERPNSDPPPPRVSWLPEQGPVPQGSNYVHHAHAALALGDWLTFGLHYLNSWSPNDFALEMGPAESASLSVLGGDVHFDHDRYGFGYVGYSRADGENLLPLADGVELLHAKNGLQFTDNYFQSVGEEYFLPAPAAGLPPIVDTGTLDSVLFQYLFRLGPALGWSAQGRDLRLAAFGMFNHASTEVLDQDRLKFGAEVSVKAFEFLSGGVRFDRVMPNLDVGEASYSALTPRLILHSSWISREYVILGYTRYFLGDLTRPSKPYDSLTAADPNLFVLSAAVSF